MSERTTGATDAQIEAAANLLDQHFEGNPLARLWGEFGNSQDYGHHSGDDVVCLASRFLVPPGFVIAPAADVLTAEIKQAMKFALFVIEAVKIDAEDEWSTECFCEATHYAPPLDEENGTVEDHIDLIRAIADGGAK